MDKNSQSYCKICLKTMKSDNVEKLILNKDEIYDAKYDEIKTDVFDEISNNSEGVPDHTGKRTRLFFSWLISMKPKRNRNKSKKFVRGIKKVYTICLTCVL